MEIGDLTNAFLVVCFLLCVLREAISPLSSKRIRGTAEQSVKKAGILNSPKNCPPHLKFDAKRQASQVNLWL